MLNEASSSQLKTNQGASPMGLNYMIKQSDGGGSENSGVMRAVLKNQNSEIMENGNKSYMEDINKSN